MTERYGNMVMTSKNDSHWYQNYEALKAYIEERGHLPDKHKVENRSLLNFSKYTRKKIKERTLGEEKRVMFEALLATRSTEHTGGRRKASPSEDEKAWFFGSAQEPLEVTYSL